MPLPIRPIPRKLTAYGYLDGYYGFAFPHPASTVRPEFFYAYKRQDKFTVNQALVTSLLLGMLVRLFYYLGNRSFWLDELYLNASIITMSLGQLLTPPIDDEQKAPMGCLVLVKLAVTLFGPGERPPRLVSLRCGVGTLWFFVPVARYFLQP